jgi:hypothetical protein
VTIVVIDHGVERYLQRVRGVLDPRPEVAGVHRCAEVAATPANFGWVRDEP